jgi:hypothetical protein
MRQKSAIIYINGKNYEVHYKGIIYLYEVGDKWCYTVINGRLDYRFRCNNVFDIGKHAGYTHAIIKR